MPNVEVLADKIATVEKRVSNLENELRKCGDSRIETQVEIKGLKEDFRALKEEVLVSLSAYTEKTWKLIFLSTKVIAFLIAVIILICTGIKIPTLLNFLK